MLLNKQELLFEDKRVAYWESGQGEPLLLLHGSGPGASSHGNWRLILEPLSKHFHVIATDLIGFGESDRKTVEPYFDYDLWFRQATHMLGLFQSDSVNILGHSLSGALALKLAAHDRRVNKVVTTGTVGADLPLNPDLDIVWTFPETEDDLIQAGKTLVYDDSIITQAYIDGRKKVLYDGAYKEYFSKMFQGDKSAYIKASILDAQELTNIKNPVLLIHGRDDDPIPAEGSIKLASELKNADLIILSKCGHSVAIEHPEKLVGFIRAFL